MARRFIILSLSALWLISNINCQSSANGYIKGEGDVVKQEITLEAIQGVNLGISGEVILTQGSPQKIVVEAQRNIINILGKKVEDGVWDINLDRNVKDLKPIIIHITLPSLKEVSLGGSGTIRTTNKFTGADEMNINVAGSGSITMDYTAGVTDLNLSGSGKISLSGESKELSIAISGSGDVVAPNLITESTEVHISGSGDAAINANKSLEASISGSGDVQYKGSPSVDSRIIGSGSVSKMN